MRIAKYLIPIFLLMACDSSDSSVSPGGDGGEVGTGGSLARFTISKNYLYAVDEMKLTTFSIANEMAPQKVNQFDLDWGVETIFAMDTIVFVGTQTGMHMFDVAEGSRPAYLANYEHIQSCDPVVAQDTLAFVTLRSGSACRNGLNQLDIIDIRNLRDPKLIASHQMDNPHGLAVRGNYLFVCEGQFGMKVFEIKTKGNIELINYYNRIASKDVILRNDSLMIVVADDGIFQYDYSDVNNIKQLSQIRVAF